MLQLIWNSIAYLGVPSSKDMAEHKHIVLVNGLSLVLILFISISISILAFFDSIPMAIIAPSVFYSASLILILWSNKHGKTKLARLGFVSFSVAYVVFNSLLIGVEFQFQLFLLVEILAIFFVFPASETRRMLVTAGIVFAVFLFFQVMPEHQFNQFQTGKADHNLPAYPKIILTNVAILLYAFAFYIQRTFRTADRILAAEREKSERLLRNILPDSIATQLKEQHTVIAERFDECTVLFSDLVGFTSIVRSMPAVQVVSVLNEIFSAFDDLTDRYQLEKIKTIGDAYMVVSGLPEPDTNHAEKMAQFAIDMMHTIQLYRDQTGLPLELRIGINSGDAVAGVIGKRKFNYDLWGDSVNTASRMESHGLPGQIQVTETTYQLIKDKFLFKERGLIEVKGLGMINSYLLIEKQIEK